MPIYDVTWPISETLPVWPGDPPVTIARASAAGAAAVSQLCLGSHTGTHVDPPAHFFPGGATVDQIALGLLMGPAWVALLAGPGPLRAEDLDRAGIPAGSERLLLRTANSDRAGAGQGFDPHFVALAPDAAGWLLDRRVSLVGIDGPSIETYDSSGDPVHRRLLAAGVIVVENLALAGIEPGPYQFCCLPLRVMAGDGAPARAVLVREA